MGRFYSQIVVYLRKFFSPSKAGRQQPQTPDVSALAPIRPPPEQVCFGINERTKIGFDEKENRHFVRASKLLPRKLGERWELSTYSVEGMIAEEYWRFLTDAVEAKKPLAGKALFRCDGQRNVIGAAPLMIDDNWDPPRHVDVVGWPEAEDAHLSIAQKLSDLGAVEFSPDFARYSRVVIGP